jgi:hypothetical protein
MTDACECGNEPSDSIQCGIFCPAVDLLAFQEGIFSIDLVSYENACAS